MLDSLVQADNRRVARRRHRSGIRVGGTRIGFYGALIAILFALWLVSVAFTYWYFTLVILAAAGGAFYWWRQRGKRAAERAQREHDAEWEANRQAWRDLTWDEGSYSVVVSGFVEPDDAHLVFVLLSDTPAFRDRADPEMDAHEVVERIEHIAPQAVAEGIAQYDAIHFKRALEERGAKVKITETVRVRPSSAGPRKPIPAPVRREVWRRDGGKCVDCGSRERLEYDHIIAVANGGSDSVRNIELRCETCNRKKAAKV